MHITADSEDLTKADKSSSVSINFIFLKQSNLKVSDQKTLKVKLKSAVPLIKDRALDN